MGRKKKPFNWACHYDELVWTFCTPDMKRKSNRFRKENHLDEY